MAGGEGEGAHDTVLQKMIREGADRARERTKLAPVVGARQELDEGVAEARLRLGRRNDLPTGASGNDEVAPLHVATERLERRERAPAFLRGRNVLFRIERADLGKLRGGERFGGQVLRDALSLRDGRLGCAHARFDSLGILDEGVRCGENAGPGFGAMPVRRWRHRGCDDRA